MPSNDWGESWASFSGYDQALDHSIEKTIRLNKFLTEAALVQMEFSKKLREITNKHQQKYTQIRPKSKNHTADLTADFAFKSLVSWTMTVALQFEKNSKSVQNLMNTDLSQTEKRAKERQQRINHDGQKLKAHLNEQQRRLENSKSELMKRRKEQDQAKTKYLKYRERSDKNIGEEDKLRVASSDKEALTERAKEEFNRQAKMTNETQKQYYLDSLPNLCRAQQEVFKSVTTSWRVTLKEIAKYNRSDNEVYQKATLNLSRDVDQIDRSFDSDVILTQVRRPNTLPPEVIAIMDEPANMTQRTITQQNAEIVSNLAGTSISKESPRESRRSKTPERREKTERRRSDRPERSDRHRDRDRDRDQRDRERRSKPSSRQPRRQDTLQSINSIQSQLTYVSRSKAPGRSLVEDVTEWDDESVMETFGRGRVLYDFVAEPGDDCISVLEGEVIDVSLRDQNGWSKARRKNTKEEGFIPTSYFELIDN